MKIKNVKRCLKEPFESSVLQSVQNQKVNKWENRTQRGISLVHEDLSKSMTQRFINKWSRKMKIFIE